MDVGVEVECMNETLLFKFVRNYNTCVTCSIQINHIIYFLIKSKNRQRSKYKNDDFKVIK